MTLDYDLAPPAPQPISSTIANYLRRSVSLSDLLRRVLREWVFVVVGILLGLVYGVYQVWNTVPSYTATMNLLPADSNGGGASSGDTGGALGLLAALGGVNSGSIPKFTRFVAAMPTEGVARELDKKYDMICVVYRSQCNLKTHQWSELHDWNAKFNGMLAHLSHQRDPNGPRTVQDLAGYITSNIDPEPDKKTGMLTVTFSDHDPKFASEFLSRVVQTTNDYIKDQDRDVSQQYVDYLTRQLANSNSIAQHDAMSNLLLQQERNLMLTGVNVPYAASSMDKPTIVANNPMNKILALDTVLGFFLGIGAALILTFLPEKWRRRS